MDQVGANKKIYTNKKNVYIYKQIYLHNNTNNSKDKNQSIKTELQTIKISGLTRKQLECCWFIIVNAGAEVKVPQNAVSAAASLATF